jgi:hypothetical protein
LYERILIPLDGSEVAEAALPFAARIPSRQVRLVYGEPANGAVGDRVERIVTVARDADLIVI